MVISMNGKNGLNPEMLSYEAINDLKRAVKRAHPKVKRYFTWTMNPAHKGKTP